MEITVPSQELQLKDSQGETILVADLLDVSSFLAFHLAESLTIDEENINATEEINRIKHITPLFNAEFNCSLSWGQLRHVITEVENLHEELKKN
jgi:hypothetical protein